MFRLTVRHGSPQDAPSRPSPIRHFAPLGRHRIALAAGAGLLALSLASPLIVTSVFAAGKPETGGASAPADAAIATGPVTTGMSDGSVAPIVSADKPSVVTIVSDMQGDAQPSSMQQDQQEGGPPSLDEFFRRFMQEYGDKGMAPDGKMPFRTLPHSQTKALGSGFVLKADGIIVTNNHVVDGGKNIKVQLDDGTELPARIVGRDAKADLAVLKVDAGHALPAIAWGDSDRLSLGDRVLAIGNPFGIGTTVTSGIVSARGRDLDGGPYDDFLQVDAAINSGNSGGPLVAMDGSVVGIDAAIYSPNGGNVGVGFAIPSNEARGIVDRLIEHGSIEHGFLGVEVQPVTPDIQNALGLSDKQGALVASVGDGSPAAKAGIKAGDIVTAVGDTRIENAKSLARTVADLTPQTRTSVTVLRQGKSRDLKLVVGNLDAAEANVSQPESAADKASAVLGMQLGALTKETRETLNLPEGTSGVLVEDVDDDSAAADDGIQPGDVILSVDQASVKKPDDLRQAIEAATASGRKRVLMLVERGEEKTFVAVAIGDA